MKVATSICDLIGNTPTLKLNNFAKKHDLKSQVFVKLESFNPLSSVKDRIGYAMVKDALTSGKINQETTLVEPTSGNTGIALAFVCAALNIKLILTMPETMSIERRKVLNALGAKLVLTEGSLGMKGAIAQAQSIVQQTPNSHMLDQFSNTANPLVHKKTTAKEIYKAMGKNIDIFVSGVGTGGTVTGVGEFLKEKIKGLQVVAVEPYDSPMLSKQVAGPHKIQGIGAGFVPQVLNTKIYDKVVCVKLEDAIWAARELALCEGVLVGISSGAALYAAIELAKSEQNQNKNIVCILPDSGERYLSTLLFDDIKQ